MPGAKLKEWSACMLLDRCGCDCAGFVPPFSWPHHLNSMSLYRALTGQDDPICQGFESGQDFEQTRAEI